MDLRQSTASQEISLGQFLDDTDGNTEENGLTIANTDIKLRKSGATTLANKNSGGATNISNGVYTATLDATDTDTAGELEIYVHVAGALAVKVTFNVLTQTAYDAKYTGTFFNYDPATDSVLADVVSISGGSTAADNLEAMYDGTGYVDDNAPATRLQVSNIGASNGGSINFAPTEDNTGGAIDPSSAAFVGSVVSGTFADIGPGTADSHSIDDAGNDIDIVYGYQVGGNRIATSITVNSDVDGGNDQVSVRVYNHSSAAWVTVGEIDDDTVLTIPLTSAFTGTGAELGKVYVRFETEATTPENLTVFECLVAGVFVSQSVGYSGGSIWVDTVNGVAGVEPFVNGTADNPVLTWADALTISSSVGLSRFAIGSGSTVTLTAAILNYEMMGQGWIIDFNGQSVAGAYISGAVVSGTFVGDSAILEECTINAITGSGITMRSCFFNDVSITANAAGNWFLNDCRSRVAGTDSPNFDFGAGVGDTSLNLRAYSGGIEIENMGDTGADFLSIEGNGALTVNANCDGGTIASRGNIRITDNSGGNPTFSITPDVTGYQNGFVWVDENSGTSSGSVVGIDGTFQNQSDDFDNAQAVADALGTGNIIIRPGNSITLSAALQGYTIDNVQATLNGGSQNVDSTRFNGGFIVGTFTRAGTGIPTFSICNLSGLTTDRAAILACGIVGTLTLTEAGLYPIIDSQAAGPTGTTTLDYDSLAATVNFERWTGNLTVNNLVSGSILNLHCSSGGDIVLNGADATVNITGAVGTVTNNLTGAPSVTDNSINLININSEVDTSLADYDGPTNAEMEARTILAADYFDPAADTVANVTLVDTTTANTDMRGTDEADVRTQVDGGLVAIHLDHLLAVLYDSTSPPGNASALLNVLFENDAGVPRYTANSLENAPSGGGGGSSDWTTGEKEQIRHRIGIDGTAAAPATGVPSLASQSSIDDLNDFDPDNDVVANVTLVGTTTTNTDMRGTDSALLASGYTAPDNAGIVDIESKVDTIDSVVDSILVDTGDLQTNQGNWLTATGFSTHSAADIWSVTTRTLSSYGTLVADVVSGVWANITRTITGTVTTDSASRTASQADISGIATPAQVLTQVNAALEAAGLDHLFQVAYDPDSKPGVSDGLLNIIFESDAGVPRYTVNALENAPAGGGGGSSDWTTAEKEEIRTALGVTGDTSPLGGTPALATQSSVDSTVTILQLLNDYHDNTTKYFGADGTTEVIQSLSYFMVTYADDGTTELKRIGFQNASGNSVVISSATRYIKL